MTQQPIRNVGYGYPVPYMLDGDAREPAGKHFPEFVTDEVMPLVDGAYRTRQGHPDTGIGGSSYGGVVTLDALMAKPSRFGYGLIESPSLSIGMGQLVRDANPLIALPAKVSVAFGGKDADDPGALQTEASWAARLPGALTPLFGEWKEAPQPMP